MPLALFFWWKHCESRCHQEPWHYEAIWERSSREFCSHPTGGFPPHPHYHTASPSARQSLWFCCRDQPADKGVLYHDGMLQGSTGISSSIYSQGFLHPSTIPSKPHKSHRPVGPLSISPFASLPSKSVVSRAAVPHPKGQGTEGGCEGYIPSAAAF